MTQLVTVQTDFRDIEQMAHGLTGRVQTTYVILPTGDAVDEGEWAQFEIALFDGTAGLAGLGRCVTLVDNGDERSPHQRFDVVLDSLQFDAHEQRVFEHILALHGMGGSEVEEVSDLDAESLPPTHGDMTGDVDVSEVDDDLTAEPAREDRASGDYGRPSESPTLMGDHAEIEAALSDPSMLRPAPGGEANDVVPRTAPRTSGGSYGRGGTAHALQTSLLEEAHEEPLSGERVAPTRAMNGAHFAYKGGIPFPAKPPRPELDEKLRVTPAPRPDGTSSH